MAYFESTFAQDPGFSQFFNNELYLNPAFAGSTDYSRVSINYRNQWPGLQSTFVTYCASFDRPVEILHGGVGLYLMNDIQGDGAISCSSVDAIYSYKLQISRYLFVNAGFQSSFFQKRFNSNSLVFPDMRPVNGVSYPTQEILSYQKRSYFDFSVGFIGFFNNSYLGIAIHHLTQPNESFANNRASVLPRKYTVHFGTEISLMNSGFERKDFTISPNILFQRQQQFQQVNYGFYLTKQTVFLGLWLRQDLTFNYDSFIILVGFSQSNFKFAYSYDLSITGKKFKMPASGAHEVTVSTYFKHIGKRKKIRAVKCRVKIKN